MIRTPSKFDDSDGGRRLLLPAPLCTATDNLRVVKSAGLSCGDDGSAKTPGKLWARAGPGYDTIIVL